MARLFKEARQMHKLTIAEAAEQHGVSSAALSTWESGKKSPTLGNLIGMAELYRTQGTVPCVAREALITPCFPVKTVNYSAKNRTREGFGPPRQRKTGNEKQHREPSLVFPWPGSPGPPHSNRFLP